MANFACSAILFDLDGVLVNSTGVVDQGWRAWAQRKGVDEEKVIAIAHGVRTIEIIRQVAPHLDAAAEAAAIENREAAATDGVAIMPGAIELVRAIPDGRWGVVTSAPRLLASTRLRFVGLPVPEVLVAADDVANGKPHPEPYLKGAEQLGLPPSECLVIEDSPAGIQSAREAGMKVVALSSTYDASELRDANAVAPRLGEIQVSLNGKRPLIVKITS
ncbi:MAG TPA: HAD-IA family hydrolase [Candidatus Sulfotelmatobacter sp.]|nr:HAD-IA family hydrolase [Candidatus Sulfotelmatobacter sp.]